MSIKKTIPVFVPHSGCPNDCVFCNQKRITGVTSTVGPEEAESVIREALSTIDENMDIEIAFFGGSFTAIEKERQIELLSVANRYRETHNIKDIRISTRPDAIDEDALSLLKSFNVTIIELGVQSLDENVLMQSNRGHDSACVYRSSELILKNGFKLGLQMMLGLPGDSAEKVRYTADEFIRIAPHFVRIYPVLVIKDTGLESLFKSKVYQPWSVEKTVEVCKDIFMKFAKNNIKVIRMGLQTTDDIMLGKDVVAGPFHPAIGELIYSRVYRDLIEKMLTETGIYELKGKTVDIEAPGNQISKISGNRKSNKEYFKEKYDIRLKIVASQGDKVLRIGNMKEDISFLA